MYNPVIPDTVESKVPPQEIGEALEIDEFNGVISLLKHFNKHNDNFRIDNEINGTYGDYIFDLEGINVLDTGILITTETITAEPKIKLTNNKFKYATYTLKLNVLHYTGANILDDITPSRFKIVDTIEIELIPNTWVDIPVASIQKNYIISLDANVEIKHNKTELHKINGLMLDVSNNPIQKDETTNITAQLLDFSGENYDLYGASGRVVYFFEKLLPTINLSVTNNPIQTGDTTDITATVRDADGSIPADTKVHYYQTIEEPATSYENDGTSTTGLTIDTGVNVNIVNEGLQITTSTNGEKYVKYPTLFSSTDNFLFECEIAKIGVTQSIAMFVKNATTANGCWFAYTDATGKFNGGVTGSSFNENTGGLSVGDKIKIRQDNKIISIYHNDNLVYRKNVNLGTNYQIGHYTNKDREQFIKNVKIWKW